MRARTHATTDTTAARREMKRGREIMATSSSSIRAESDKTNILFLIGLSRDKFTFQIGLRFSDMFIDTQGPHIKDSSNKLFDKERKYEIELNTGAEEL